MLPVPRKCPHFSVARSFQTFHEWRLLVYLSATLARRWSFIKSRSVTKCKEVSLYKVRGVGGSGVAGLGSLATRCSGAVARVAFGLATGVGGASSTGCGMGSTLTFRCGARSLLPAGRPLLAAGASLGGGVFSLKLFGIVAEFWRGVVAIVGSFSGIVSEFSGIFASASAIFEILKHFSINCQSEGDVCHGIHQIEVSVAQLKG